MRAANACVSCAFCSGGRVRSVVPIRCARLVIRSRSTIVASSPGFAATSTSRPLRASASMLPAMCGPPTSSRITSAPPSSLMRAKASSAPIASAPSAATAARCCSLRTLATTRAPSTRAIWTAAVPTPPLAPFTSTVSPATRPACRTRASNAVRKTSGTAAAWASSSESGTLASSRSAATTRVARPPPPTRPNARSPDLNAVTASPTSTTVPATSIPGMSAGQPAGTGWRPSRCSTSAGLMPANAGAITTSNLPGDGSGRSSTATTSGPPTPLKTTHLTAPGTSPATSGRCRAA